MDQVIEYLKSQGEVFQYRVLVDSSPLLERFLAEKTGFGWIGQNSCFYTKTTGSWIFLGEILLTIDLDFNDVTPAKTGCKNCIACIKACPTSALKGEYTLQPQRCLAYIKSCTTKTSQGTCYDHRKDNTPIYVYSRSFSCMSIVANSL